NTHVTDAGPRQLVDERAYIRKRGLLDAHRWAPSAARIGRSFNTDSSYSLSGSESPMIPQPANKSAASPRTRAERKPTANSPSPAPSIQPTGPAYQPRSSSSISRMSFSAASVGQPPMAGVGCTRDTSANTSTSAFTRAVTGVYK